MPPDHEPRKSTLLGLLGNGGQQALHELILPLQLEKSQPAFELPQDENFATVRLQMAHCQLDSTASGYLEQAMDQMRPSARAHDRILKVARTLADLAGTEKIQGHHILEAIQHRALDRKLFH